MATLDWSLLHNRFYRKIELYSLLWRDVDLAKHLVAAAPLGGPVALIRNDSRSLALNAVVGAKQNLFIYTCAGKLINQIQWDKGRIVAMSWSSTEHLVCVLESGSVRILDIWGDAVTFSLGQDAKDSGVLDCRFWESGLVALTGNLKLILVEDFKIPRPTIMADPGLTTKPSAWVVIPPQHAGTKQPEVLLAVKSTLLIVNAQNFQDQRLQSGPFVSLALSPNGKFISFVNTSGKVIVISADFQKQLAEFNAGTTQPPIQMAWCGADSVTIHWEDALVVVGPFGDCIRYAFEGIIHLVSEIDGVRIITNDKCQFLQKVPNVTEEIFKIGSTAPGAILFDAYDHFQRKSPRADENIRSIKSELSLAVDACLEAAANEFNSSRQKLLLKVGRPSFGKCFIDGYNAEKFTNLCETVRILNAVRRFEIGIPLSFPQYVYFICPTLLIGRLAQRHHHSLALQICTYLKINPSRVLVHWACTKIKNSVSGGDISLLLDSIVSQCTKYNPSISYLQIAKTAYQQGQSALAAKLLDHEPIAANQVPLLMSMEQDDRALTKAIESGDTDLAYAVILHIKRKHPMAEFFRILKGKPVAMNLVVSYARVQDIQLLKDFYYQDDRRTEMAGVQLQESFELSQVGSRINKLKEAQRLYLESKDRGFEAKAVEDQIRLLQLQGTLERETGEVFCDLTVSETIYKCLVLGHVNRAAKVKSDLKVPERRYLWLKVKALVEQRNWEALDKFVKTNPKSMPLSSVVEVLTERNELAQAKIYSEQLAKGQQGNQEGGSSFLGLFKSALPSAPASAPVVGSGTSSS
ncbi:Vps16, N-terminal region-domain-containing protein [Obelidium mucronatum]|nr:Vps16, N-terminal region-domain-containing protein [Obelidium mucronatum]